MGLLLEDARRKKLVRRSHPPAPRSFAPFSRFFRRASPVAPIKARRMGRGGWAGGRQEAPAAAEISPIRRAGLTHKTRINRAPNPPPEPNPTLRGRRPSGGWVRLRPFMLAYIICPTFLYLPLPPLSSNSPRGGKSCFLRPTRPPPKPLKPLPLFPPRSPPQFLLDFFLHCCYNTIIDLQRRRGDGD